MHETDDSVDVRQQNIGCDARGQRAPRCLEIVTHTWPQLRELRSLTNIEKYLNSDRAELASDPSDERLRAFIEVVEGLLRQEKTKLAQNAKRESGTPNSF
jgi:hypothetical protein